MTETAQRFCAVTLIRDAGGKVVFWHRSEHADPREAVSLWGKAVGTAFGTELEVWLCGSSESVRFYPVFGGTS